MPNACLLIIGNEILSGRTQDVHLSWLARELGELGIPLTEVRVVPDNEKAIIEAVNQLRTRATYLFTTGGIGPTHDDITTACIAKALGRKVIRHTEAERRLTAYYPAEKRNAARMKMADVPEGAELVENPVSVAPGFRVENIIVLAGVPSIMRAMFEAVRPTLTRGAVILSRSVSALVTEGAIADELAVIQNGFPDVEIGSYPFMKDGKLGTSLVARSIDPSRLDNCALELAGLMARHGAAVLESA